MGRIVVCCFNDVRWMTDDTNAAHRIEPGCTIMARKKAPELTFQRTSLAFLPEYGARTIRHHGYGAPPTSKPRNRSNRQAGLSVSNYSTTSSSIGRAIAVFWKRAVSSWFRLHSCMDSAPSEDRSKTQPAGSRESRCSEDLLVLALCKHPQEEKGAADGASSRS